MDVTIREATPDDAPELIERVRLLAHVSTFFRFARCIGNFLLTDAHDAYRMPR
jgi:hypothetical protein